MRQRAPTMQSIRQVSIERGTTVLVAAPQPAWPRRRLKAVSTVLAAVDEVAEAHLPQILELGAGRPASTVLFVVVEPESAIQRAVARIVDGLGEIRGLGTLGVWAVGPDSPFVETVRRAGCAVGWRD